MHTVPNRQLATFIMTAGLCFAAFGNVEASPLSYDYTFNPTDVLMNNNGDLCTGDTGAGTVSSLDCKTLLFTFVLDGHSAATDTLDGGSLQLTFYDDNTPGPDTSGTHQERVNISLDSVLTSNSPLLITTGSTSANPFSVSFGVLAELENGELTVLLTPSTLTGNNDFFFASSRLIADGEREETEEEDPPPTQLPEPVTMLLFGTGALGMLARNVRRR